MDYQRLRNLTTGRLHTEMGHIYQDLEFLVGCKGLMTHQLPNACRAIEPWLRHCVTDERFWDGEFDQSHVGDWPISPMPAADAAKFWERYSQLPSPFAKLGAK